MPTSPRLVDHMMSKMEGERADLQKSNESLSQELQNVKFQLEESQQSQSELRQKLKVYETNGTVHDHENRSEDVLLVNGESESVKSQIKNLRDENQRLQMVGETLQKRIADFEEEKASLHKQIESIENENNNLRTTVVEAKHEIRRWQDECHRVKELLKQYEENLDDAGDLNGRLEERERVIKKMNRDLTQVRGQMDEQLDGLKQENTGKIRFMFYVHIPLVDVQISFLNK